MSQITIQEDKIVRYRSIIRQMDLYHQGKISWEEYKQISEDELQEKQSKKLGKGFD